MWTDPGWIIHQKFVRYIEGSLFRKPPVNEFSENYQNVRYIKVKLIISLQNRVYLDLKNFCKNISVPSRTGLYIAMALETQEQANKTA